MYKFFCLCINFFSIDVIAIESSIAIKILWVRMIDRMDRSIGWMDDL